MTIRDHHHFAILTLFDGRDHVALFVKQVGCDIDWQLRHDTRGAVF